jgi:hypothetical protein
MLLFGLLAIAARAETFQLADGSSISGTVISSNEKGVTIKKDDGTYTSPPLEWDKFTQDQLKAFLSNSKVNPVYVDAYIDITDDEAVAKRAEVTIQPVRRLDRPTGKSLIGALFSSPVGIFAMLALYAANIFAAYEIAIFRAREKGLVCGVSAIAPLIGPIIFLSMANKPAEKQHVPEEVIAAQSQKFSVQEEKPAEEAQSNAGGLHIAHNPGGAAAGGAPETQVFGRDKFMFNRRFFETKFSGFFGMVRRADEKEMVLLFKTGRAEHVGDRITRISANELHLQSANGEVMIPFAEIKEVQLKHKDA